MMMTGCDLSAITKPWEVQSKVGTFEIDNSAFTLCFIAHLVHVQLKMPKNILLLDRYLSCFQRRTFTCHCEYRWSMMSQSLCSCQPFSTCPLTKTADSGNCSSLPLISLSYFFARHFCYFPAIFKAQV